MSIDNQIKQKRIDDSRELYLKYEGQHHELIEKEMRALGHHNFHRRILYSRFERGRHRAGWIERFGWERLLAGNAGTLACMDAEASRLNANTHTSREVEPRHAGGTGVAGKGACVPGEFDEFRDWLKRVSPAMTWDWKHQVYIYKRLRRVTTGECKRLMIFLPPRHGKSEMVTVRYAAWRLKKEPSMNIIVGSYNQRHASKFSRKIRNVLLDDEFLEQDSQSEETQSAPSQPRLVAHPVARGASSSAPPEPGCPPMSVFGNYTRRRANSEAEWETAHGGGLRAVGVGGGVTGYGASLIIIDDPVKNRAEAESENQRDKVWDWFNDDVYTRLEPNGAIVLIQTRWHEDDLAGRLLREMEEEGGEQWEVVNLPALAESKSDAFTRSPSPASMPDNRSRALSTPQETPKGVTLTVKPPRFYTLNGRQIPVYPLGGLRPGCYESKVPAAQPLDERKGYALPAGVPEVSGGYAPATTGGTAADVSSIADVKAEPFRSSSGEAAIDISTDPLGRTPGEALWPERYNEADFERLKRKMGSYSFAALYQQRPVPAEGGLFKRAWFKIVSHAPPGLKWKRGYDAGISKNSGSDYTASLRVAFDRSDNMYIDGGFRKRIEYPELRRYILGRIAAEPDTEHGIELSANGNAVVQDLRRESAVRGRAFRGVPVKGDKITRALPWIALAEDARVFLVRGGWNSEFIEEACSFPQGSHDDQIDAVSIAVLMHKEKRNQLFRF